MEPEDTMKHVAEQLQNRKLPRHWPYHVLITRHDDTHAVLAEYHTLATLLRDGYFATVLTTNVGTFLEEALERLGIARSTYKVLIVGRDDDTSVADALQCSPSGISIVKLYRDTNDEVSAGAPVLSCEVMLSLQYYLCRNIIIIGSLEREPLFTEILNAINDPNNFHAESSIYYVIPTEPVATDPIVRIKYQYTQLRTSFIISRNYGMFEGFFSWLTNFLHIQPAVQSATGAGEWPTVRPLIKAISAHITDPVKSSKNGVSAAILLVAVTSTEVEAVLAYAPHGYQSKVIGTRTYYDLGVVGEKHTFLLRAIGPGPLEAYLTVRDGIEALSPKAVIMVGIAFGYDRGPQNIGDIMIATQIQDYDAKRVGSTPTHEQIVRARGSRMPTSQLLLDRFINSIHTIHNFWPDAPNIHSGIILSGSSLVDHEAYRDQLRLIAPDAIGGEMEGFGLIRAVNDARLKVECILIKAISDWADGNKNANRAENQRQAADNVARFTLYVMQQPGFL